MTARDIFINSKFQLRAGWRIAIFLAAIAVTISIFGLGLLMVLKALVPAGSMDEEVRKQINQTASVVVSVLAGVVSTWIVLKLVDKRSFRSLGLFLHAKAWNELGWGLLIGFAMLTVAVTGMALFGWEAIGLAEGPSSYFVWGLLANLTLYILVGFNEEILFRGYLFQSLTEGTNKIIPTLAISVLFAFAHIQNPNVSTFGLVNIFLAGVLLGLAYYRTLSLWMPIGIHIAWNFTQGYIWGLPVSGTSVFMPLTISQETGPDLITGGTFGPEGGAMCSLVCIGACLFIWKFFKPSDEMNAIVNEAQNVAALKASETAVEPPKV